MQPVIKPWESTSVSNRIYFSLSLKGETAKLTWHIFRWMWLRMRLKAAFPLYVQVMFCGMWMVRVFNVVMQPSRQLYKSKMWTMLLPSSFTFNQFKRPLSSVVHDWDHEKNTENTRDERKMDRGEISFAIFSKIPNFCSFQASSRSELQIRELLNQTLFDWQVSSTKQP